MSILGPLGAAATNVAGSLASSLRNNAAEADRVKTEQAVRKTQSDVVELSQRELGENVESNADRDADGRLPWTAERRPPDDSLPPEPDKSAASPATTDPGAGGALDVSI